MTTTEFHLTSFSEGPSQSGKLQQRKERGHSLTRLGRINGASVGAKPAEDDNQTFPVKSLPMLVRPYLNTFHV